MSKSLPNVSDALDRFVEEHRIIAKVKGEGSTFMRLSIDLSELGMHTDEFAAAVSRLQRSLLGVVCVIPHHDDGIPVHIAFAST
jgi:hypothetical protein